MKLLIKKSPDGFIKSVNDELTSILSRNLDSFFPEYIEDVTREDKLSIPVELHEKENEYLVKAELPGIKKEDLDIDIDETHITIQAKKEEEKQENTKYFKQSEFKYGEFTRSVYFPMEIDVEKTSAKLEHGILKIVAPKKVVEDKGTKKLVIE